MGGCLDPDPIIHWVRVCLAITDFARLSTPKRYRNIICSTLTDGFSAFDFLKKLDLIKEENYFRSVVEGYARNAGLYEGADFARLYLPRLE